MTCICVSSGAAGLAKIEKSALDRTGSVDGAPPDRAGRPAGPAARYLYVSFVYLYIFFFMNVVVELYALL